MLVRVYLTIINVCIINCRFDPVDRTSKDYFLNRRGAKVYFDINKQLLLERTKDRIFCDALAVGCSQEMIPLITIAEAGNDFSWFRQYGRERVSV